MIVITKLFGTLIKTVLVLLMLALLTPTIWITWRVHQPMYLDEFGGHTYVELLDWAKADYVRAANALEGGWHGWGDSCYGSWVIIYHFILAPTEFFATFLALDPQRFHRERFVDVEWIEKGIVAPDNITLAEFLPAFWLAYERHLLYTMESNFQSIAGCRLSRSSFNKWANSQVTTQENATP